MNKLIVSAMIFTITASLNASDYPPEETKILKLLMILIQYHYSLKKLYGNPKLTWYEIYGKFKLPESTIIFLMLKMQ